jgi:prolyl 4-hydroxylase
MHFQADVLQDNDYATVLLDQQHPVVQTVKHAELDCLRGLAETTTKHYIQGMTYYAKTPTLASMYPDYDAHKEAKKSNSGLEKTPLQAAQLTFTGFGAKFVNLSPTPVLLYWDGRNHDNRRLLGEIPPMDSLGTATTPGQSFSVTPVYDSEHALARWVVTADESVVYYEPEQQKEMTEELKAVYQLQKLNEEFAKHYLIASGRTWLAHFPRAFPLHHMWQANHFGQEHSLTIGQGDEQRSLTMTVQSVTPKVFTIPNFLSSEECDALIQLALHEGLHGSTVYAGSLAEHSRDTSTRSSSNTWLARDTATLTDDIYQRAAQVLRMDAALFQKLSINDDVQAHVHSIAESLQVVRYKKGEEYTPHHDFVYPSPRHRYQPTRFATLLLYLNDDFEGGHTVFPRAVNRFRHDGVRVQPEKGTAVLFYSVLEDGNVDDLSQHSGAPVEEGEKVC